jgi:hypothetical protein
MASENYDFTLNQVNKKMVEMKSDSTFKSYMQKIFFIVSTFPRNLPLREGFADEEHIVLKYIKNLIHPQRDELI